MYNEALTKRGFNDDIIYTLVIENSNLEKNKTMKRKKYGLIHHILRTWKSILVKHF